jgi:hypothetical protein
MHGRVQVPLVDFNKDTCIKNAILTFGGVACAFKGLRSYWRIGDAVL